ncbi:hypothetical protein D3C72_553350 [compost metagenome]
MLTDLFLYTLIWGIFVYYFLEPLGHTVIFVVLVFLFVYAVPVIIIHINYYKNDKETTYEFTNTGFIQKQKKDNRYIEISEVIQIDILMTTSRYNQSGYKSFPFSGYYYARIKTKDGSEITLTSLFSTKLDIILKKHFYNVPITYDKTFYPIIN